MEIMPSDADRLFTWERQEDVPKNRVLGEAEGGEQVPGALKNFMDDTEIPAEVRERFQEKIDHYTDNGRLKMISFMVARAGKNYKGWLSMERENVKEGESPLYEPGGFTI
jgi:hypothetical protein